MCPFGSSAVAAVVARVVGVAVAAFVVDQEVFVLVVRAIDHID
jgi:hypothetical protein